MANRIKSYTAKSESRPNEGAFDCLRLLAAFGVLFSHCYPLLGKAQNEPFYVLSKGVTLGTIAVYAFFAISGYLVTKSWVRDPSPARFMLRRSLRIFPALIFVVAASIVVVGPLTTDLAKGWYFSRPGTWSYLGKILIYPTQYGLPGVFENNPEAGIVNGSLWTLRLEFSLYILVAVLGLCGILKFARTGEALVILCGLACAAFLYVPGLKNLSNAQMIVDRVGYLIPFFVGMSLARHDIDSRSARLLGLALIIMNGVLCHSLLFKPLLVLSVPYATLLLAHNLSCHLGKFGDYSYGVYLWAFPVEQALIHFSGVMPVARLLFLASIVTFAVAIVSWHGIEKHALRLKPRKGR